MKKNALGIAAVAALMTLSTGMTAFAAGWVTESTPYGDKSKYLYDNGDYPVATWFTDPETKLVYHLDPDGYRMTETTVDGYWLDAGGVRQEKSEEQLEREARETAQKASKPNPGKKVAADKVAALDAKSKNAASGTTRSGYIAELKTILTNIVSDLNSARTEKSAAQVQMSSNNLEVSRYFRSNDSGEFYRFSMWLSKKDKDQAADIMYMYDAAPEADRELYNTAYERSVIAALGETEGKKLTDYVQSQREQGETKFTSEGATDTGNSYTMKYNNNRIDIQVTCSEVVPQDETETTEETAAETTTEEAAETQETTSSTVVAGSAN
mgnify:FL=1